MIDQKTYEDTLSRAINTYGAVNQMRQCVEEMAELMQAICKYIRYMDDSLEDSGLLQNIAEEVADVHIMTDQLAMIVGGMLQKDAVNKELEYKVNRLKERLDNEQRNIDRETDEGSGGKIYIGF